jgi:hypothetical protein
MLVSLSAALSPLLQCRRASLPTKEEPEVNFSRDISRTSCSGNPRDRVVDIWTPIVQLIVFAGTLQDVARQEVPDRNLHLRRNSESFFLFGTCLDRSYTGSTHTTSELDLALECYCSCAVTMKREHARHTDTTLTKGTSAVPCHSIFCTPPASPTSCAGPSLFPWLQLPSRGSAQQVSCCLASTRMRYSARFCLRALPDCSS